MFDLLTRNRIGGTLAAGLLLMAACGGQAGSSGSSPRPTASPAPSAALGAPSTEPTVHPPVLASPASSLAVYGTAADAARFVAQNGLSADTPEATWRPAAVLHVIHATGTGGADYQGDWYFFFVSGRLVGQQFFSSASSQSPVDDATFSVTYSVFRPGDPHCCASGGETTVRFHWNGNRLIALDPVSGAIQT